MTILLGILIIGFGLLHIFARDVVWSWTQFGNRMSGRASERTPTWDTATAVFGGFLILCGCYVMALPALHPSQANRPTLPPGVVGRDDTIGLTITLKSEGTYEQVIKRKNGRNYVHTGAWQDAGDLYLLKDFIEVGNTTEGDVSKMPRTNYLPPKDFFID